MIVKCPKCSYENQDDALYCGLCYEPFKKGVVEQKPLEVLYPVPEIKPNNKIFLTRLGIFLSGIILYPLVNYVYLLNYVCQFIDTIVHELGHTVMFLVFGQIAFPSLNISGGGETMSISTGDIGIFVIIGILGLLIFCVRENKTMMLSLIVTTIVYTLVAFSKWNEVLICAAGHIGESVFVGIAFYRCLISLKTTSVEKPIYSILGWWIIIHNVTLFYNLKTVPSARIEYIDDPRGLLNDLVRIAHEILNCRFEYVADVFICLYFIPVLFIIVMVLRKRKHLFYYILPCFIYISPFTNNFNSR